MTGRAVAALATLLLIAYGWTGPLALVGNFSIVDALAAAVAGGLLLWPRPVRYLQVLATRTSYLAGAVLMVLALGVSVFGAVRYAESGVMVVQLIFSLLVVVPGVAVLCALAPDPNAVFRRVGTFNVLLFFVGWLLLQLAGIDALVRYTGVFRVFARWDGMVFWWIAALAPRLVQLGMGSRFGAVDALLILLSVFVVLANASRALMLALAISVVYTFGLLLRAGRLRASAVLGGGMLVGAIVLIATNLQRLAELGFASRYTGGAILEDRVRGDMYGAAFEAWYAAPGRMLFGIGEQFHVHGQVIHNVFLQVGMFGGIFALVGIILVLASPLFAVQARAQPDAAAPDDAQRISAHTVYLACLMSLPWLMTHPLQASRWYWAFFGAVLGVALEVLVVRGRAGRVPDASAPLALSTR